MLKELDGYDWEEAFCEPGASNSGFNEPTEALPGESRIPINIMEGGNPPIHLDPFCREDVVEIYGMDEGIPDELSWIIYGRLKDDRCFYLEAGCDYTGWD
jgi:hypothetical protein